MIKLSDLKQGDIILLNDEGVEREGGSGKSQLRRSPGPDQ